MQFIIHVHCDSIYFFYKCADCFKLSKLLYSAGVAHITLDISKLSYNLFEVYCRTSSKKHKNSMNFILSRSSDKY